MTALAILSAIVYLLIWHIPRFGKFVTIFLLALQILFYAYATTPTTPYYVELIERNSGVKFIGDVDVRWGWASQPFGFPNIYADRAVDVLIVSDETNIELFRNDLRYSSSFCEVMSAKAAALYGGGVMEHCWKGLSSSGRDDVYIAMSDDYKTLYFHQR